MALQPGVASADVAERLAEAGAAGDLLGGTQLADEVRARLAAHEDRCRALLQQGHVRFAGIFVFFCLAEVLCWWEECCLDLLQQSHVCSAGAFFSFLLAEMYAGGCGFIDLFYIHADVTIPV